MPLDDAVKKAFVRHLGPLRRAKDVEQKAIAKDVGVSKRTMVSYAAGTTLPRLDVAVRIADHLGVTLDELVGRDQRRRRPRRVVLLIDGETWAATAAPGQAGLAALEAGLRTARAALEADGREEQPHDTREATP